MDKKLQGAFALLDQYNREKGKPEPNMDALDRIVARLFVVGYIIRPLRTMVIKDEAHADVLHPDSNEWGLVDRVTWLPVARE